MSGHSKWNNIKRRKGAQDAAKGKIFTKLGREIQLAVKQGGPDPATNRTLEDVIAKAKANNMPNDTINRSIKKASGSDAEEYEEIIYEGYGEGGVAIMVRCLSNNRNRTAGEVRHLFGKYNGNLGENGCVSFMFENVGYMILDRERYTDEDTVMMEAIEAGADDVVAHPDYFEVLTSPSDYHEVHHAMQDMGYEFMDSGLEYRPLNYVQVPDEGVRVSVENLLEALDDFDDVTDVFHNMEDTDEED
ncbi:MAG: YebC/PmpR family DNA-binding transcriptional regulator [Eubacteriales bacterium]|nr:YebC/PmpR family DNA-binding transcriptional regulator [Eubacteriales bacterium]